MTFRFNKSETVGVAGQNLSNGQMARTPNGDLFIRGYDGAVTIDAVGGRVTCFTDEEVEAQFDDRDLALLTQGESVTLTAE